MSKIPIHVVLMQKCAVEAARGTHVHSGNATMPMWPILRPQGRPVAASLNRGAVLLPALLALGGAALAGGSETPPLPEERAAYTFFGAGWTPSLAAGGGAFTFTDSLYAPSRPDPPANYGDNWSEAWFKGGLSFDRRLAQGLLYGSISAVGEGTFGADNPEELTGGNERSLEIEDLAIGWRSGMALGDSENLLDISIGRQRYTIGQGFLVWDGAAEGGSRGGYWSNARMAWDMAGIARLNAGAHTLEAFYLERNDLPEDPTDNRLGGLNYEYALNGNSVLGLTWFETRADSAVNPVRDGMEVLYARAFLEFANLPNWNVDLWYADQSNGSLMASAAWAALVSYTLSDTRWSPRISYRHAEFEGDDPATARSEAFDPLFAGFSDFGTWIHGEVTGDFFLPNSNRLSDQLRLDFDLGDHRRWGIFLYRHELDQPGSFFGGVASSHLANEYNLYLDWSFNRNWRLWIIGGYVDLKAAAEEAFDRTDAIEYAAFYLYYNF